MAKDPQDKIDRLFSEALRRPAGQRAAFLREHCHESEVRHQVASLLEDYEAATDLFDGLADAAVVPMLNTLRGRDESDGDLRGADLLDLEGTTVGRYAVDEHLGGGGMGVVYRARDPELGRAVALKFLPPHLASHPEAEQRFVREARAAAGLDHPNIATVHEIGRAEEGNAQGQRFIAMAFYAGETLKEKMAREGPLPVEEAVGYATQIAEGLSRAHEAGVVHRDVKPANVMVTEAGAVKIVDFGLAWVADQTRLTEPGRRVGTAAYMSPEQAEGGEVGARTDLWALGVLFYEMLAGKRPFEGDRETAVLHAILHEEPEPVQAHRPEVPSMLERTVERCLRKDPDRRYASATALLDDLRTVDRGGSSTSPGVPGADEESVDRSIAVLPFETLGTQETTAFTDGIHGDLLTRLSNVGGLQVISRTSVRTYRNTDKALRRIARELGVKWMVEGEVQEVEEQVQVNARVVNARTDRQVWARDYRRVLTAENLFEIQSEITEAISQSLEMELTSAEKERVERRPTENLDAYRLYARGREHLDQRTEDGIRRAFECFQRAIEEDSNYALAWAGLTDALSLFEFYGFALPDDAPAPMEAARRAVDLGPPLGEAHAALGILHAVRREGIAALRELERALELAPSYAESHVWMGWLHLYLDRPETGLPFAERAVDLDPLAPAYRVYLAENYLANGRADAALREARRAREIQPEYGLTHYMEGVVLHHQGRLDDAISALQRCLSRVPPRGTPTHAEVRAALAVTRAASGDRQKARERGEQIDRAEAPFSKGLVHAALGAPERAFECFEEIRDWGSFTTEHARYFFPEVLGPLREDPRYDELLRTVNEYWGLYPDGRLPEDPLTTDP
jgi:serine/threonine protein kinase/tetratricopeptide (TPR) repeat protein